VIDMVNRVLDAVKHLWCRCPTTIVTPVRIVVWNARMGLLRKKAALSELRPDLAVIPECAMDIGAPAGHWIWVGLNRRQGLGVLSYGDYRVSLDGSYDPKLTWAAPIAVTGPHTFFLLAIWAPRPYREPVHIALETYRDQLSAGPAVVAGDFNQNSSWDRPNRVHNHGRNVELMRTLGLVSAYHHHFKVIHGEELDSTHYWRYETRSDSIFHIDYCFVPKAWLKRVKLVELGTVSDWIDSRLSDHVPLVVDIR
jgi:exodeoxyribonuclease III